MKNLRSGKTMVEEKRPFKGIANALLAISQVIRT